MVQTTKTGKFWKQQVDLALTVRSTYEAWWDSNLLAYAPSVKEGPEGYGSAIHTNRTFTLTERKKADLFYQRPDVTLQPTPASEQPIAGVEGPPDPQTGMPSGVPQSVALSAHQAIVNEKLGEDGVDATEMMDSVLFDVICTQAFGATEMGYEQFSVDVPKMQPVLDPLTGEAVGEEPAVDPLTGEPAMVPVPVKQHCFWEHFSGKALLIPHNFRSTKWDRAPWLGRQFTLPLTEGNRKKYRLPSDFEGKAPGRKQHYDHGVDQSNAGDQEFSGVVIWYRSMLFRDDRFHPDHFTQLVLVDGIEEPVIHEDSPHQTLDERGQLTPDSLIGNPIHPFSVRKLTDSAYPPSDATMIRPLENELDIFRTQMVQFRDASTLKFQANGDVLPAESLNKIVRSPIGGIIVVPGEAYVGEGAIKELPHGSMPRESFLSNDYIDNDMARLTAIDAAQSGVESGKSSTATEQQIVSANANARIDKERGILLKQYLKGVTKFSTLIMRYLPLADAVQIVGPGLAQVWDVWRKQATSSLAFTALPDSALRVDQAVDRKSAVELYSFLANDPFIQKGRAKLLEKLLRKHHVDPTGIVSQPDPAKPEPPKLSIAIKGEDFVGPQAPVIFEIAQQLGLTISEQAKAETKALGAIVAAMEAAAAAQAGPDTQHGGKAGQQESLSKHASDRTGGMQGTGAPAALGAGGGMLQ